MRVTGQQKDKIIEDLACEYRVLTGREIKIRLEHGLWRLHRRDRVPQRPYD